MHRLHWIVLCLMRPRSDLSFRTFITIRPAVVSDERCHVSSMEESTRWSLPFLSGYIQREQSAYQVCTASKPIASNHWRFRNPIVLSLQGQNVLGSLRNMTEVQVSRRETRLPTLQMRGFPGRKYKIILKKPLWIDSINALPNTFVCEKVVPSKQAWSFSYFHNTAVLKVSSC